MAGTLAAGAWGGYSHCRGFVLILFLTERYQNKYRPIPWMEMDMVWLKDAVAGIGLVFFVASSFALTSAAQAIFAG